LPRTPGAASSARIFANAGASVPNFCADARMTGSGGHNPEVLCADLVVLGGGLTGLTLACAVAGAGIEVLLVEREPYEKLLAAPYDGRVMAVARASKALLEAIGAWEGMAAEAEPIRAIRVEEGGMPVAVDYDPAEIDGAPLGWIVETRVIRRALHARLQELAPESILAPARYAEIETGCAQVQIRLTDGRRLAAPLLAVCEGRHTPLREQFGIGARRWSYGQTGIVCTLGHERPHHGLAIERFFPDGPFAVLPMKGDRSSIVWALENEAARSLRALSEGEFLAEVAARFGDRLGGIELLSPRWFHPLVLVWSERYAGDRIALVGDSARGVHPIAGQGWNLALRDVAAIAEIVVDRLRLGLDPGDRMALEDYEAWRRFDSLTLVAITDGINRLFANDLAPLRLARNAGLWLVERTPPLKRFFMRHAMGLLGELPRLMRGQPL